MIVADYGELKNSIELRGINKIILTLFKLLMNQLIVLRNNGSFVQSSLLRFTRATVGLVDSLF